MQAKSTIRTFVRTGAGACASSPPTAPAKRSTSNSSSAAAAASAFSAWRSLGRSSDCLRRALSLHFSLRFAHIDIIPRGRGETLGSITGRFAPKGIACKPIRKRPQLLRSDKKTPGGAGTHTGHTGIRITQTNLPHPSLTQVVSQTHARASTLGSTPRGLNLKSKGPGSMQVLSPPFVTFSLQVTDTTIWFLFSPGFQYPRQPSTFSCSSLFFPASYPFPFLPLLIYQTRHCPARRCSISSRHQSRHAPAVRARC